MRDTPPTDELTEVAQLITRTIELDTFAVLCGNEHQPASPQSGAESSQHPIYPGGNGPPSRLSTSALAAAMAPASEAFPAATIGSPLLGGQITTLHAWYRSLGSRMSSSHVRYLMVFVPTCRVLRRGGGIVAEERTYTEGCIFGGGCTDIANPEWSVSWNLPPLRLEVCRDRPPAPLPAPIRPMS
jgi:hypothetical protein